MIDARKHTLDSVKKLTDYSDFNLYKMDIYYDYSIDKIIDRGIFDDESALGAIVQEVLPDYPVNLKMPNFGCSAFIMKNPDSVMMGRNYDFKNDTSSMLVYCSPKDGYRSVAFAALDNVGANNPELSDGTRLATLLSPFISLDGINEKGVSIAVLTLDSKPVRQQSGKPVIATTLAIRLILDRAASTEEAVTLFEKYDMFASSGRDYHFYVTDSNGDGRVIEYDCNSDDRKLVVTKSPAVTNFFVMYKNFVKPYQKNGVYGHGRERYDKIINVLEKNNSYTKETAWEALVSASQAPNPNDITSNTQWSIVYDNTNLTADISIRRDWKTVTKYSLKENTDCVPIPLPFRFDEPKNPSFSVISPLKAFSTEISNIFSECGRAYILICRLSLSSFMLASNAFSSKFAITRQISDSETVNFSGMSIFSLNGIPLLLYFE